MPQLAAGMRSVGMARGVKSIEALEVEAIIPGHGDPCGKAYLKEQGQIVENWVGYIERFVERGMTPDEILQQPLEVTKQDPYPIGQRMFIHDERLTGMILRNLHQRILDKTQQLTGYHLIEGIKITWWWERSKRGISRQTGKNFLGSGQFGNVSRQTHSGK